MLYSTVCRDGACVVCTCITNRIMCILGEVLEDGNIAVSGFVEDFPVVMTELSTNNKVSFTCTAAVQDDPGIDVQCTWINAMNASTDCATIIYSYNNKGKVLSLGCFTHTGLNTTFDDQRVRSLGRKEEAVEFPKGKLKYCSVVFRLLEIRYFVTKCFGNKLCTVTCCTSIVLSWKQFEKNDIRVYVNGA